MPDEEQAIEWLTFLAVSRPDIRAVLVGLIRGETWTQPLANLALSMELQNERETDTC